MLVSPRMKLYLSCGCMKNCISFCNLKNIERVHPDMILPVGCAVKASTGRIIQGWWYQHIPPITEVPTHIPSQVGEVPVLGRMPLLWCAQFISHSKQALAWIKNSVHFCFLKAADPSNPDHLRMCLHLANSAIKIRSTYFNECPDDSANFKDNPASCILYSVSCQFVAQRACRFNLQASTCHDSSGKHRGQTW